MKRIAQIVSMLFIMSCTSESDTTFESSENNSPVLNLKNFQVAEHSQSGTVFGTVEAEDKDNDQLTFTVDAESGLQIDENTGEISLGNTLRLDFETNQKMNFKISVFDGQAIVEEDFELDVLNVEEFSLLTDSEKDKVNYFEYLTLWKDPSSTSLNNTVKWTSPMKIFLDGSISNVVKTNIENSIAEVNDIVSGGSFSISLVENLADSNTHLFFGNANDIENLWPDIFEIAGGNTIPGYATFSFSSGNISSARIWVSSTTPSVFQHELGHSIGLGHSNQCDSVKSVMCATVSASHSISPLEKEIIGYLYNDDIPGGLNASEIEFSLASLILKQQGR